METVQAKIVNLRQITKLADFEKLHEDWNKLLDNSIHQSVFLTWEYTQLWMDTFKVEGDLYILTGHSEDGTLIGIAPFMIKRRTITGLNVKCLEFITSGKETTPDHLNLIVQEEYQTDFVRAVFEYLKSHAQDWDMIKLADMTDCAALLDNLKKNFKRDFHYKLFHKGICPYINLSDSWDEYKKALSRKIRQNIGKRERKIAKEHEITYVTHTDPETLLMALERLRELHIKRMDEKSMDGVSRKSKFWEFHTEVAQRFLKKNWMYICTLNIGDLIVAGYYAYRFNDKVYIYQSGIDPAYGKYSVGFLLNAHMVKESHDWGMKEFDFLRGGEEYKFHWAKQYRTNVELYIWHKSPTSQMTKLLVGFRQLCRQMLGRE